MKNTKQQRNQKGFTMIELMIVVVIMGIIGAAIVPTFGSMSKKARITSDVSNIKILQRQADIYEAETGEKISGTDAKAAVKELIDKKYLEEKYVESDGELTLQTPKAVLEFSDNKFQLDLTGADKEYKEALKDGDPNLEWIKGATSTSSSGGSEE